MVITSKFGEPVLRKFAIKEIDLAAALVLQRAPTIGPPANVSPLWLACRYRLFKGTGVVLEKPVIFPNVYSLVRFLQRRGGTRGASNATFCLDLEAFFSCVFAFRMEGLRQLQVVLVVTFGFSAPRNLTLWYL